MRAVLGAAFGLLVLGATAYGLVRWALNGCEDWAVLERSEASRNGHREVETTLNISEYE